MRDSQANTVNGDTVADMNIAQHLVSLNLYV